ncbi:MAG: EF-P beta-lysylation protein EpmB [Pseudomonadota bacterium]
MIAAEPLARQTAEFPGWQRELAEAVRDPVELLDLVGLTPEQLGDGASAASLREACLQFPLRVPRAFISRMRRGDPHDPLLLQVLAVGAELLPAPGYSADPLHEAAAREAPGLLHKYHGRALLITTGACAVHCRYCFRRHFDYGQEQSEAGSARWSAALDHVAADASITEIILSGGDPLSLGNSRLCGLLRQLHALAQLKRIRIHTRTPIVLPSRIDGALLEAFDGIRDKLVIVVHANHAAEIDAVAGAALRQLSSVSTALLNQSVLLAGVNDSTAALAQLSTRLFEFGVLPYYLHQLDPVAGAAHFAVPDARARQLAHELIACLPGYLVPRLVREIPGEYGKTPL